MRRREFLASGLAAAATPSGPWRSQRIGANCFNRAVTPEWIEACAAAGIRLVRLTYEKWGGRDYLLGSADAYQGLVSAHLKQLIAVLDALHGRGIASIVTPLTLPGARWRQMNGGKRDGRLWRDAAFRPQCARFWRDLAGELKGHPGVAGLDLLNEPAPELEHGRSDFREPGYEAWARKVRGGAGDLNLFHAAVLEGVRAANSSVPVAVETGLYATPWAIEALEPLPDANTLYSIHMYEPYEYTTWRKHQGKLRYPSNETADPAWLDGFFDPVRAWMKRHGVPAHRILVGEFGCGRRCPGAGAYLGDLIRIFDREGWHWLFYAFREDAWEGMDYELGATPPPGWYWDAAEAGSLPRRYRDLYSPRAANDVWRPLRERLERSR